MFTTVSLPLSPVFWYPCYPLRVGIWCRERSYLYNIVVVRVQTFLFLKILLSCTGSWALKNIVLIEFVLLRLMQPTTLPIIRLGICMSVSSLYHILWEDRHTWIYLNLGDFLSLFCSFILKVYGVLPLLTWLPMQCFST